MELQLRRSRGRLGLDMPGIADLIASKGAEPAAEGPELGVDVPEKPAAKAAPAEEPELLEVESEGPKQVPLHHLKSERVKRQEAEARAKALETDLGSAKERAKALDELYGKFEKPLDQMREDASFAQAVYELREDPIVKQALAKINQHYHGAAKVTDRAEKPAEPTVDPRVEMLFQERMRDTARSVLSEAKVKKELHGVLTDYVLKQNPNPTREAVLATMNEYVMANGWTKEFIREAAPSKQRPTPLPNPGGLNGGAPPKDAKQPDKPKNLAQAQDANRNMVRELMQQRGIA